MELITCQGMGMPKLGLGTWPMKGAECTRAVESALALGYRHIDTAGNYGNEDAVGEALAATDVPREDIHVTTKVWHDQLAPDAMRHSIERSLRNLKSEYVDLFLIHWPTPDMDLPKSIATLRKLRDEGKARAIGVSNFPTALMRRVVEELGAPIACNQVEYHVLLSQKPVLDYARQHNVAVTAYSPIAKNKVADIPELQRIAGKHDATPAQIALKWLIDQDCVAAIPKAASEERQKANLAALHIALDDEDRATIAGLPKNQRFVAPGWSPVWDQPTA
jgi:2,5-diketo-D-gluconate reductase B